VVSSDRRPEELQSLTHEISSRFATGVIVEVDRPDAALRFKILRRRTRLEGWSLSDELVAYVAHNLNGDIRTLEGVAMKLVAMRALQGIDLDRAVVDRLLQQVAGRDMDEPPHPEHGRIPPRAGEEGVPDAGTVAPWRVNPLVREFAGAVPVSRTVGLPGEIAPVVPQGGAGTVVVLGTSSQLVMNTVEAMAGRDDRPTQFPQGESWAYLVHRQCDCPNWILLGTGRWDRRADLAQAAGSDQPPVFVVVLDGENPELVKARHLISSVLGEGGLVVVVLGSFLGDGRDSLPAMLRRLLRVPQGVPVLVQRAVDTAGSRTWVSLALQSRAQVASREEREQAISN
jgi:hypothetical protein